MPWAEKLILSKQAGEQIPAEGRVLGYTEALNEALAIALEMDPNVFVLGQGVDDPSGMFGVSKGLKEKFGEDRVFDTPLSEEGLTGICVGAAMTGMRPVYMHNRPDFLVLAFNQIVNHAAKIHWSDYGKSKAPLVIWAAIGRGWGSGTQHSQAIQGLLLNAPGLKIVMPSEPYDAKGLMLSAIADNNPVLIFEHRWLMKKRGVVPEGFYGVPLGKGTYRRTGSDATIVGSSHILDLAIKAVDALSGDGITADVIDLRTLKPLDEQIIFESVAKTGKILIVDTGWITGGVCAEVGCLVAEKAFEYLKAPVRRIALPDLPHPAGFALEEYYYPDETLIAKVIREMVGKGVTSDMADGI